MSRRRWIVVVAIAVAIGLIAGGIVVLSGGSDDASAQTITFQKPAEAGPDPFTRPTDIEGEDTVEVGSGPFGGTGSDLVCDRELLIRSLRARPDRMRAWAEVLGIEPNMRAVARYIRKLRPVTLTRDTRVTNHSFEGGDAVGFQAILQAGTAVLVNEFDEPVVRCRCGNPLTKEIYYPKATCYKCPPDYEPPPPCEPFSECWDPYPNPPPVTTTTGRRPPDDRTGSTDTPSAAFSPSAGTTEDTYTLSVSGFNPNSRLTIRLTRPDGVSENYSLTTDSSGSGSYTFPRVDSPQTGTYTAAVSGPGGNATASTSVSEAGGGSQPDRPDQQTTTTTPDPDTNTTPGGTQDGQPPTDYGY